MPGMSAPPGALRREHLERIRIAALDAVEPARAVARFLARDGDVLRAGEARLPLASRASVRLVAAGKAAAAVRTPRASQPRKFGRSLQHAYASEQGIHAR